MPSYIEYVENTEKYSTYVSDGEVSQNSDQQGIQDPPAYDSLYMKWDNKINNVAYIFRPFSTNFENKQLSVIFRFEHVFGIVS